MGNAAANASQRGSVGGEDSSSTPESSPSKFSPMSRISGSRSTRSSASKLTGSTLPPLHVVKDNSSQTVATSNRKEKSWCTLSCTVIVVSVFYFSLCILGIFSVRAQSLLVYSAFVNFSSRNLTDLHKLAIPTGKNIEIITEDGLRLKGWHIMHPGKEILRANQMHNEYQRNVYFDKALAHAERIVIYFHGNSFSRGAPMRINKIKQLATYLNAHVVTFDYRGFADSEGRPSEEGTFLDSRAVVQYVDNIVRRHNAHYTGYLPMDSANLPVQTAGDTTNNEAAGAFGNGDDEKNMGVLSSIYRLVSDVASIVPTASSMHGTEEKEEGDDSSIGSSSSSSSSSLTDSDNSDNSNNNSNRGSSSSSSSSKRTRNHQPHLYLYGHSLGSAVATALAVELNRVNPGVLQGLILDAPFTTMPEAARNHPMSAPFRLFPLLFNAIINNLQIIYPTIDRIQQIGTSLMIMHGDKDFKIPFTHAQRLFQVATNATVVTVDAAAANGCSSSRTCAASSNNGASEENLEVEEVQSFWGNLSPKLLGVPDATSSDGKDLDINSSKRRHSKKSRRGEPSCASMATTLRSLNYPVELHIMPNADHNMCYSSREWIYLVPSFVSRAEKYMDNNWIDKSKCGHVYVD